MTPDPSPERPLLTTVALLCDLSEAKLARGQVGAVVASLDEATALVEFGDDEGKAYAVIPCAFSALPPLRAAPLAA